MYRVLVYSQNHGLFLGAELESLQTAETDFGFSQAGKGFFQALDITRKGLGKQLYKLMLLQAGVPEVSGVSRCYRDRST